MNEELRMAEETTAERFDKYAGKYVDDVRKKTTPSASSWRYEMPKNRGEQMLLLTIGGVAVIGNWYGELGQYLRAWAPLPQPGTER
jgi:hypothetical protein